MKLAILTSDIIDGIIISQRIITSGCDVRAIIYEKKHRTLKYFLKRLFYRLKGANKCIDYAAMARIRPGLIVKAVDNINSDAVKSILRDAAPELIAVIGTRKLEEGIFGLAKFGAINMHSGILPYYRGADSEFWALYNGEKDKVGVSVHFIENGLDTGDIVLQAQQRVLPSDNHISLRKKNTILGADKIVEAIKLIESGRYKRIKQDENKAKVYKSAKKEDKEKYYLKRRKK